MENFRLDLWFTMKSKPVKVRSVAGLFLEILMFVFIFAYANGDFVGSDNPTGNDKPLKNSVLSYSLSISVTPTTDMFVALPKSFGQVICSFTPTFDFHDISLAFNRALSVSLFERNPFYIISMDHVP